MIRSFVDSPHDTVLRSDCLSPAGGILRGARRPPGWAAPGPPPRPPVDKSALWPRAEEDLCWLAGNWRLLQRPKGHRFSVDDLVTAYAAGEGFPPDCPPQQILDLGCGIGSVLLFLAWRFPGAGVQGIEAQELSAEMATRSIAWNGVEDRCGVRVGDFRQAQVRAHVGLVDLVTGTPPYFPLGTGLESDLGQRGPCRFEHRGGVEAYCAAAVAHMHADSHFVLCAAPGQRERLEGFAPTVGLKVCARMDVIPKVGKAPLFHVYTLTRPPSRALGDVLATALIVRDANDVRTEAFEKVRWAMGMPPAGQNRAATVNPV